MTENEIRHPHGIRPSWSEGDMRVEHVPPNYRVMVYPRGRSSLNYVATVEEVVPAQRGNPAVKLQVDGERRRRSVGGGTAVRILGPKL